MCVRVSRCSQVSDFGLTKFKTEMKKSQPNQLQGSLHWTAPEILNESDGVDYTLADVYSFGAPLPPRAHTTRTAHHLLLRALTSSACGRHQESFCGNWRPESSPTTE
jgi:serine/threonine protein kinase